MQNRYDSKLYPFNYELIETNKLKLLKAVTLGNIHLMQLILVKLTII